MDSIGTVIKLANQLLLYFDYQKGRNLSMATSVSSNMLAAVCIAIDAFTSQDVSSSLVEEHNQNLSQVQKELLQCHWKLGHCGFQQMQTLLHSLSSLNPIILTKHKATSSCPIPLCASCKIARLTCQTPTSSKVTQNPLQLMAPRRNDLTVRQTVSLDQYVSSTTVVCHILKGENLQLCNLQ